MHNDLLLPPGALGGTSALSRPKLALVAAVLTALACAAMCAAAILTPAPAAVVPLIVAVCVGCPLFASWNASDALAAVRADRRSTRALARMRRALAQLPETEHPLGF